VAKITGKFLNDTGATLKTQIHISQLTARQELALNAREMTAGKWK
jgi:hypothetical protein